MAAKTRTPAKEPAKEAEPVARPTVVPCREGDDELSLTELLRDCLDRSCGLEPGITWKHRIISSLLRRADDGDQKALLEVWLRIEGKAGAIPLDDEAGTDHLTKEQMDRVLLALGDVGDKNDDPDRDGATDVNPEEPEEENAA